jgi:uncharacterized YccA/Bax inhibitor family protein
MTGLNVGSARRTSVRSSSNPVFRNLPGQGGYAGFDDRFSGGAGATATGYQQAPAGLGGGFDTGRATERPMTVDDVVTKTAITAGLALAAGVLTAVTGAYFLILPAFIIGLVISLIIIFKQSSNPALVLTYSAAEGIALGGITGWLQTLNGSQYAGIGFQAIAGTFGVFVGMLVVYKTGAVKVTPRLTKMIIGAMFGVIGLMLINMVVGFFTTGGIGIRSGGPLAYLFSIVVIGIAAFTLLLDFDMADRAIRAGAPARMSWYIAFGLMTTLVWLYLEVLRLLSYMRQS